MLIHIPQILDAPTNSAQARALLHDAPWADGGATAGPQAAQVKRNQQLPRHHPVHAAPCRRWCWQALERHTLFFSAALPARIFPPMFNRYGRARPTPTARTWTTPCASWPTPGSAYAPTCRARSSSATPRTTRAAS